MEFKCELYRALPQAGKFCNVNPDFMKLLQSVVDRELRWSHTINGEFRWDFNYKKNPNNLMTACNYDVNNYVMYKKEWRGHALKKDFGL